jgi:serine/threonine protein kinase, bacterial
MSTSEWVLDIDVPIPVDPCSKKEAMPLTPGQTFAGYTILRLLGSGGMGEVYLAEHPRLPRQEAVKILRKDVSADDEFRVRFNREADMVARLFHPNIVGIHDRGDVDGALWISMDFVDGTDAGQLLADRYRHGMPPDNVVHLIGDVAAALDYAHQKLLLHRDVKPANILLTDLDTRPRALLADFGIARRIDDNTRLTATSMTVGTVAYAAPEQLMGAAVDGRADQYALAATAFQLLTGSPLFHDANPAVVISKHLTAPPPEIATRRPELSDLGPVFSKALAKSPGDRYDTCGEFAAALRARSGIIADELGVYDATQQALVSSPRRTVLPRSRPRPAVAALAVLAVVGVAIAAYFVVGWAEHRSDAPSAGVGTQAAGAPEKPVVPVVLVGADCATLGAAGLTPTGQQAYCAKLPSTGDAMWSLYQGQVPGPTVTPAAGEATYAPGIEQQVRVCIQETGADRATCRENVRRGNLVGPP